jgi:hypothetical protein
MERAVIAEFEAQIQHLSGETAEIHDTVCHGSQFFFSRDLKPQLLRMREEG